MSLCVRFIENNSVRQGFLQFLPLTNTTGKELGNITVKGLNDFGVNCKNLTGQSYNGATSATSGAYRGAQALFGFCLERYGQSPGKSIRRHYKYTGVQNLSNNVKIQQIAMKLQDEHVSQQKRHAYAHVVCKYQERNVRGDVSVHKTRHVGARSSTVE